MGRGRRGEREGEKTFDYFLQTQQLAYQPVDLKERENEEEKAKI
jgi:hypothetical protein